MVNRHVIISCTATSVTLKNLATSFLPYAALCLSIKLSLEVVNESDQLLKIKIDKLYDYSCSHALVGDIQRQMESYRTWYRQS